MSRLVSWWKFEPLSFRETVVTFREAVGIFVEIPSLLDLEKDDFKIYLEVLQCLNQVNTSTVMDNNHDDVSMTLRRGEWGGVHKSVNSMASQRKRASDIYCAFGRQTIILIIIAHIYNAPNTLFLGATHIIIPVIGFRLTRNTIHAHFPLPGDHTSQSQLYKPFYKQNELMIFF